MTSISPVVTLSPRDYDAVLFDLDGVLTKTATVHAAAWKRLFDRFLAQWAADTGAAFVAFDIDADYRRYVDGKPRDDGVVAFLASRGIALPFGAPEDDPDAHTVHALGRLKDHYFLQHLEQHGVEPDEAAVALVRTLRAHEVKTAVVSSSNNCAAVLEVAGIAPLFDARVDGMDLTGLTLNGKPAPDASWRRRSASRWNRRARWSWRTRPLASRRDVPADSAVSSVSIAAGNPRRCARPAPVWW